MSDLKACPFCGRIPDIEDCGEHRWFIRCKCGIAQDKLFFQKCDAVRAWNKRKELRVKDTNVPITDTISRQAALDAIKDAELGCEYDAVEALPSVQPKKGMWCMTPDGKLVCSCCYENPTNRIIVNGDLIYDMTPIRERMKFCPNCGASMSEGEEDEP